MSRQNRNLLHRWVVPDDDLVLRVSVRRDQLVARFGPRKVADLRARVNGTQGLACESVPKANAAVGRASTAGQNSSL